MELKHLFIPELKYEVKLTEIFFHRIPMDKLDFKPHQKSMSMKELVNHLAEIPGYIALIMESEDLDIAGYKAPNHDSKVDLLNLLSENAERAEAALKKADEEYQKNWRMRSGENTIFEMPRLNALRSMALSQLPHHRAQLGVYYRLLDIPVPASYGPSADEN